MTPQAEDMPALEARTRALLDGDRLSAPTRRVLKARLEHRPGPPRVLSPGQMRTLEAVCLRAIPEPELVGRVQLAAAFEARLADAVPRGWRYAAAPDDLSLQRAGLDAMDAAAQAQGGGGFADLDDPAQDALMKAACAGELESASGAPTDVWFEELLNALAEIYYAHPLVQVSIGYDGMADAHGVQAVSPQAIAEETRRLDR